MQEFQKAGQQNGFIAANLNRNGTIDGKQNGRDTSTLLSTILNFDPKAGCNEVTFQPYSERMLSNHKEVVDQFRSWKINEGIGPDKAVSLGRWAEEGEGNGWYVTTLAVAEQLYDALWAHEKSGSIIIGNISFPFWQAIYKNAEIGSWKKNGTEKDIETYDRLSGVLRNYADGFVDVVPQSIPEDRSMSEKPSKVDGLPLGAKDLSWSYGAFLNMMQRRERKMPPSWFALNAAEIPANCSVHPIKATYSPANNIQWRQFVCDPIATVRVTFSLLSKDIYKEFEVYVHGSIPELGSWDPKNMVRMDDSRYNREKGLPVRSVSIDIPAGTVFEYKYKTNVRGGRESQSFHYQVEEEACWYAAATNDTWIN